MYIRMGLEHTEACTNDIASVYSPITVYNMDYVYVHTYILVHRQFLGL